MAPQCTSLPDGRQHFSHGPIDLVIQADGHADAVHAAHRRAWRRFESVLPELVSELDELRRPVRETCRVNGAIARRMWEACHPFRARYITPMAAVAGSVAQELIGCYEQPGIDRAAINNGGDIALHLSAGESWRVGICTDIVAATGDAMRGELRADGEIMIDAHMAVRGIATSGWRGRSFSLGIADSVTVLAATAAQADAAATVIANAVNVDDMRIRRLPACELKDDTDLGSLPVTVDVPRLEAALVDEALRAGLVQARDLQEAGLIRDAFLVCQGRAAHLDEYMAGTLQFFRRALNGPAKAAHRSSAIVC
ncbi:UPF0280 family protein [Noviherbaspirillum cavernae]|uniref:UPF0280 family protein n=1 Tax=Noviherbaspirillum cavernae TaxID=2320862 RepID=A0A418WVC0_9BURK|nr:UPF0280 family protein [Noviherbaspirillum cavernae]RJF96549.1 UPF0280 family protein [Noviherbaspirillum cavernae]